MYKLQAQAEPGSRWIVMQARATRGVHKGTWYFEVRVTHLGATGHCRLGWSTKKGELQVHFFPALIGGFYGLRAVTGMTWSEAVDLGKWRCT